MLEIRNLSKDFGGIQALNNVSINVPKGHILGVIGPNGSGKTTLFNVVTGFVPASSGSVIFGDTEITDLASFRVARMGIARTFQIIRLFSHMTVVENTLVGQNKETDSGFLSIFKSLRSKKEKQLKAKALQVLEFLGLSDVQGRLAGELSYGQQRRLELARALASEPRLLLLDEPTSGMSHQESMEIVDRVQKINEKGCSIVIIEHDMDVIMNMCNRIVVLNFGTKIMEGTPVEVQSSKDVLEAYLGKDSE